MRGTIILETRTNLSRPRGFQDPQEWLYLTEMTKKPSDAHINNMGITGKNEHLWTKDEEKENERLSEMAARRSLLSIFPLTAYTVSQLTKYNGSTTLSCNSTYIT
jgi:hypothetical protein